VLALRVTYVGNSVEITCRLEFAAPAYSALMEAGRHSVS